MYSKGFNRFAYFCFLLIFFLKKNTIDFLISQFDNDWNEVQFSKDTLEIGKEIISLLNSKSQLKLSDFTYTKGNYLEKEKENGIVEILKSYSTYAEVLEDSYGNSIASFCPAILTNYDRRLLFVGNNHLFLWVFASSNNKKMSFFYFNKNIQFSLVETCINDFAWNKFMDIIPL